VTRVTRRTFCELAGSSLLLAGIAAAPRAATTPSSLGTVTWQLGWLETVEYAGSYVADQRGYYRAQGVDVSIRAGGPTIAVEPLIVAGKALVGNSSIPAVAQARANGAPLKIVAACWQRNPEVFLSLAARPIRTPQDLIGKRLGVPSDDLVDVHGFLAAQHIDLAQVHFVPVEYDPTPLVAGEIDAYFGISTDQLVTLTLHGVAVHPMYLEDFGYSGLYQPYVVHDETLRDPAARAKVAAFLRGEQLGWRAAIADPALGAALAVHTYGAPLGLNLREELAQARATNALVRSPDTQRNGLFWMSEAKIARAIAMLAQDGIPMRSADLFDTTILSELNQRQGILA
jgi:ABC-type nitrate/sulfonate/bicarbonate transport system substrate-binding protein